MCDYFLECVEGTLFICVDIMYFNLFYIKFIFPLASASIFIDLLVDIFSDITGSIFIDYRFMGRAVVLMQPCP